MPDNKAVRDELADTLTTVFRAILWGGAALICLVGGYAAGEGIGLMLGVNAFLLLTIATKLYERKQP